MINKEVMSKQFVSSVTNSIRLRLVLIGIWDNNSVKSSHKYLFIGISHLMSGNRSGAL